MVFLEVLFLVIFSLSCTLSSSPLLVLLLGRPTLVGKALSFTHELSFFLLYPSIVLSSHAVDGYQMYFSGSVVGKASTIGREISPTPPLILTGGQKVQNLASFKTSVNFEPPAFENAARYPNFETKVQCYNDCPMSWPSLVKLGPPTPEKVAHPLKFHAKTC